MHSLVHRLLLVRRPTGRPRVPGRACPEPGSRPVK